MSCNWNEEKNFNMDFTRCFYICMHLTHLNRILCHADVLYEKEKKIVLRVRDVALSLYCTHTGTRTADRHTYVDSLVKVA